MPTIGANLAAWESSYDWSQQGAEWSAAWGRPESQWWGAILPRIHAFMPTETILEIAPGFGRWTQYLKDFCQNLVIVDLSETCIDACKKRFSASDHITYCVNDGKSLNMIPDRSIDFVFSFDSLVHAEADCLEAYLNQLANKLKPDGVGFIHHSNAGACSRYFSLTDRIPYGRGFLIRTGLLNSHHWRARSMTAELFARYCDQAGRCIGQELINWHGQLLIDCFSLITPEGSTWARPNKIVENRRFMQEAKCILELSDMYAIDSFREK